MLSLPADTRECWHIHLSDFSDHAIYPLSLSPPIRSNACVLLVWEIGYAEPVIRTSSITTELPLMTYMDSVYQPLLLFPETYIAGRHTTIPILTFSPPAFSSTASSRTMFRNTCSRTKGQRPLLPTVTCSGQQRMS